MEFTPSSLTTSASLAGSPTDLTGPDWERLRNVVAEPVREMIAVEVDTAARARAIITALRAVGPERPHALVAFDPIHTQPAAVLAQARAAITGWPAETGLLCLVDLSRPRPGEDDARALAFWRGMNLEREAWDALDCQTIFFLLPYHYRLLSSAADHLKRWMSLKVHLLTPVAVTARGRDRDRPVIIQPATGARARLEVLEGQLCEALARGEPAQSLVRRYYLPMFSDAVSIGDLARARRLCKKIEGVQLADSEQGGWFNVRFKYELTQFRLSFAQAIAERHLQWSQERDLPNEETDATFNLGRAAQAQRNFPAADRWYRHSLAIAERLGHEQGAADIYHQLGNIAEEQRNFVAAEGWYHKSLAIAEKHGDEHAAAITYHQLGMIAEKQRDLAAAERWYHKSLAIAEKHGNEPGVASTYHQLGSIAEEQQDFAAAERWYLKALAIKEKLGDEHGAAITLHQLGMIAETQGAFAAAERWYLKALAISDNQGDQHCAASTYGQLGRLAEDRGDMLRAAELFLRAFSLFLTQHDPHYAQMARGDYARLLHNAAPEMQEPLRKLGRKALGEEAMQRIEQHFAQGQGVIPIA